MRWWFHLTPLAWGMRPVVKDARDGVQRGEVQYDRVNRTPCNASPSRFGVARNRFPAQDIAPAECWSVLMKTKFGRSTD